MSLQALLLLIVAGCMFGGWPLVMRSSGLNPIVAGCFLQATSFCVFLPFLRGNLDTKTLVTAGALLAIAAGTMNGVGSVIFQHLVARPEVELSRAILVLVVTQTILVTVLGRIIYDEPITFQKALGVILAVISIILLVNNKQ